MAKARPYYNTRKTSQHLCACLRVLILLMGTIMLIIVTAPFLPETGLYFAAKVIEGLNNITNIADVVIAIYLLIWSFRTNSNAHQLGAKGMYYTPYWVIAYYLIPPFNIYYLPRIFQELWRISQNLQQWQNVPPNKSIRIWNIVLAIEVIQSLILFQAPEHLKQKLTTNLIFISFSFISQLLFYLLLLRFVPHIQAGMEKHPDPSPDLRIVDA
jgi:hypothetical protein